ncbi:MAG: hypothetical protein JSS95_02040 [Acidobacteria bacterium]|nr:hypothetical protein [Acidobacteriota bacterium]
MIETLEFSSVQPTDGWLRRLFWPRIANRQDVDLVGQQGFWICFVVATAWGIGAFFTAHASLGLLIAATYFLGAMGVRRYSLAASVFMFLCLFLDRVASLEALLLGAPGGGNPMVGITAIVLLFLNIRATVLARRWQARNRPMERRQRQRPVTPLADTLVNEWPGLVWPRARYVFYPLATVVVMTSLSAIFGLPHMKAELERVRPASPRMDVVQQSMPVRGAS